MNRKEYGTEVVMLLILVHAIRLMTKRTVTPSPDVTKGKNSN